MSRAATRRSARRRRAAPRRTRAVGRSAGAAAASGKPRSLERRRQRRAVEHAATAHRPLRWSSGWLGPPYGHQLPAARPVVCVEAMRRSNGSPVSHAEPVSPSGERALVADPPRPGEAIQRPRRSRTEWSRDVVLLHVGAERGRALVAVRVVAQVAAEEARALGEEVDLRARDPSRADSRAPTGRAVRSAGPRRCSSRSSTALR